MRRKLYRRKRFLQFESLEERLDLKVEFMPEFGPQTIIESGGTKLDGPPVFLLFWGQHWVQGNGPAEEQAIIAGIRDSLNAGYTDGLAQYGFHQRAHFVNAVNVASDPEGTVDYFELSGVIHDAMALETDDPALYFPRPSSIEGQPIYVAITGPGIENFKYSGGFHVPSLHAFAVDVPEIAFIATTQTSADDPTTSQNETVDDAVRTTSHEIIESMTNPIGYYVELPDPLADMVVGFSGLYVEPSPLYPFDGDNEISDYEPGGGRYAHRLNGGLVQAYWSHVDQSFIVTDGNTQTLELDPIWNGNVYTNTNQLIIQGDQSQFNDLIKVSTIDEIAPATGNVIKTIRVEMNGEVFHFDESYLASPGDGMPAIHIRPGAGKNLVDLSGFASQLLVHIEDETAVDLSSLPDVSVGESDGFVNIPIAINSPFIAPTIESFAGWVQYLHDPVVVQLAAVAGGTASSDEFFVLNNSLRFDLHPNFPDQNSHVFQVNILPDEVMERDETFVVNILSADGQRIHDNFALVTIIDDDVEARVDTPTGPLDRTWSDDGIRTLALTDSYGFEGAIATIQDPDGRVLQLEGYTSDGVFRVARFNPNGTLDATWDSIAHDGVVETVAPPGSYLRAAGMATFDAGVSRGNVVVAGTWFVGGGRAFSVAKYGIDGTLEFHRPVSYADFPSPYSPNDVVPWIATSVVTYPSDPTGAAGPHDGKFIVAGYEDAGLFRMVLVRFHGNGEIDSTFGENGVWRKDVDVYTDDTNKPSEAALVSQVKLDSLGRIIVAGTTGMPNTPLSVYGAREPGGFVARLEQSGGLDGSFGVGGFQFIPFNAGNRQAGTINDIALQPDGKILAVANTYGSYGQVLLARLLGDNGAFDPDFVGTAMPGESVVPGIRHDHLNIGYGATTVSYSPRDDKILVGGGTSSSMIALRYHGDGTPDNTFDVAQHDELLSIALPPSENSVYEHARDSLILDSGELIIGGFSVALSPVVRRSLLSAQLETARSDLDVSITSDTSHVLADGQVVYTIRLRNLGDDAIFASINDTLPTGTQLVSFAAPAGWAVSTLSTTGQAIAAGRMLRQSDGEQVFTLTVGVGEEGFPTSLLTNTVSASSATLDRNMANNVASITDTIVQDLSLDLGSTHLNEVTEGTHVSFVACVRNNGATSAAYSLRITLPAHSTLVSAEGTYTVSPDGATLTWNESPLAANGAKAIHFTVVATAAVGASGAVLRPTGSIAGFVPDATPLNDLLPTLPFTPLTSTVGHWKGESNALDSVGSHNGVLTGTGGYQAGQLGTAFQFNGTDAQLDVGTWFNLQSYTVGMWVNPATTQSAAYVPLLNNNHSPSANWSVTGNYFGDPTLYSLQQSDGSPELLFRMSSDQWHHLLITRDGATRTSKVYVDGILQGTIVGSSDINYSAPRMLVGGYEDAGGFWSGRIDELVVLDHSIAPSPANAPPTMGGSDPSVTARSGETASNRGTVTDPDGHACCLFVSASIGTVSLDPSHPGEWEWSLDTTPLPVGSQVVTIQVNDGHGGLSSTTFELVVEQASAIVIHGTDEDDEIRVMPGTEANTAVILLNGVSQGTFDVSDGLVSVYAGLGNDTVIFEGTVGAESFTASSSRLIWHGAGLTPNGFTVETFETETRVIAAIDGDDTITNLGANVVVDGGAGADRLQGPDDFNVWDVNARNAGTLNGTSFLNVEQILGGILDDEFRVSASIGIVDGGAGDNRLQVHGTAGNDLFRRSLTSVRHLSVAINSVLNFQDISFHGNGGVDTVYLLGTTGDDAIVVDHKTVSVGGALLANDYVDIASVAVRGRLGNDTFTLNEPVSYMTVYGDAGDDTFDSPDNFNATVFGGGGVDTLNITGNGLTVTTDTVLGPNGRTTYSQMDVLNIDTTGFLSGTVALQGTPVGTRVNVLMGDGDDQLVASATGSPLSAYVDGGGGTDSFVFNGSSGDDTISRTESTVTSGAVSIRSMLNFESFAFFGGDGNDTLNLNGTSGDDAFSMQGNAVYVNGQLLGDRFEGIEAVAARGRDGNDTFNFHSQGSNIPAYGDAGDDTFDNPDNFNATVFGGGGVNTLNITGNGLTVTTNTVLGPNGRTTYSQMDVLNIDTTGYLSGTVALQGTPAGTRVNVLMGDGDDQLSATMSGSPLVAHVDGGGGTDSFTFIGTAGNETITRNVMSAYAGAFHVDSIAGFENMAFSGNGGTDTLNVVGSEFEDNFEMNGDAIWLNGHLLSTSLAGITTVILDGGDGSDTFSSIVAPIPLVNALGGNGNDVFYSPASTQVQFSGGADVDTLDYTGVAFDVTVDLQRRTATSLRGISGVESFVGGTQQNRLVGATVLSRWTIDGPNRGFAHDAAMTSSIAFRGFQDITTGGGNDSVQILPTGSLSGTLDGSGGDNTLDYAQWVTNVVYDGPANTATALGAVVGAHFSIVIGGAANDFLTAANRTTVFVGAGGNDTLIGGTSRDVLIGGAGSDTIDGGAGSADDLLIGGSTAHDANDSALLSILKEWRSTAISYSNRIQHLQGTLNDGLGLNGTAYLRNGPIEQDTLFDDGAVDSLLGRLGLDWFIATPSDSTPDRNSATEAIISPS